MAPLSLEGDTLGEKHRHFNSLVKSAVADNKNQLQSLNYEDPDVDNLLKIEVACKTRNLGYVLQVLQCDDMLYVSRAIKQSNWLIIDDQYAHIINPEYLKNELFPKMTSKAQNKLVLAIRLNLRNEKRVEAFYSHYSDDIVIAQKWLPYCSLPFIEKVFKNNMNDITVNTFKRLCERSITFFKVLVESSQWWYSGNDKLAISKTLLKQYAEEYLNILEGLKYQALPNFGIRTTRLLTLNCIDTIMTKFERFCRHLHLPTFAKLLKRDDIKGFLLKQTKNPRMKSWLSYDNIRHFIQYLPASERFEFAKQLFIDKKTTNATSDVLEDEEIIPRGVMKCSMMTRSCAFTQSNSNTNTYQWYRFATFDVAFPELKKMVRSESSPVERNAILAVMIKCAKRKTQYLLSVLQYYKEKHMNEPFKFKVQFVNTFLSSAPTHNFDENSWSILNAIFTSMEVYIESENSVPFCIKAIIVYKILHNQDIPEILERKLSFDTFKDYRKKLAVKEQDLLFTYLFNREMKKLEAQIYASESDFTTALNLLGNIIEIFKDWDKSISDYPIIFDKIRYLLKVKKQYSWNNTKMSKVYNAEKKFRKAMFEESLALEPTDEVCVNALKHNPSLLFRWNTDLQAMRINDAISLKHTHRKLRIYWSQTLAKDWAEEYKKCLEKPTGHKAAIEGLYLLLPRHHLITTLEKYAPEETTIDWNNTDAVILSLRKNFAKQMKLIRPAIYLNIVLSYAKGDYLQFALPSLNASFHNMTAFAVSQNIKKLFDLPVSLQKHGLRLAFNKLDFSEMKRLIADIWKNTKKSSIRAVLFKETYELLKKEKKETVILELWELLSEFIDHLTSDESKVIYNALGDAESIPLLVRPHFFTKSYIMLKSLPAKANCESIIRSLDNSAPEIINNLESTFVENYLLSPIADIILLIKQKSENTQETFNDLVEKYIRSQNLLTSYIFASKNENVQFDRYEKYIVPVFEASFVFWKVKKNGSFVVKTNCTELITGLCYQCKPNTIRGSSICLQIFKDLETRISLALPFEENYGLITYLHTAVVLLGLLDTYIKASPTPIEYVEFNQADKTLRKKEDEEKWEQICCEIAPLFGKSCLDFIKQDICSQFSNLVPVLAQSLLSVFDHFSFSTHARLIALKNMLDIEVVASYLLVLECNTSHYYIDKKDAILQVKRDIFELIQLHPSMDVKIQYNEKMYSYPHHFE